MKISVIIPTYKPKNYIWECLNSLVRQTFPKDAFEVIIVLNGCCEPWKSDIERYVSINMADMTVRLIQTDQGGVSNARNIALDNASGEFVAFIDDDDWVSEGYLEQLFKKVSDDTISLCYPYAFADGFIQNQLSYSITEQYDKLENCGKVKYQMARKFFSGPCMKLIPMNFIQDRRFDVRFRNGEDSLFMFLISDEFKFVECTDRGAVYYRRYRKNSAVTAKRSYRDRIINSLRMIKAYCDIYMSGRYRYDLGFLMTRILGAIKL